MEDTVERALAAALRGEMLALNIYDGDEFFAGVEGPADVAWAEAKHYAAQLQNPRFQQVVYVDVEPPK